MAIVNDRFNKIAQSTRRSKTPENILLRIDSYHLDGDEPANHYVMGVPVGSAADTPAIKVYLKQREKQNADKPQLQLADYANADNSYHVVSTEMGNGKKTGVMMFEDSVRNPDGSFTASWPHTMINDSSKTQQRVASGYSTVIMRAGKYDERTGDKKPNAAFLRQAIPERAEAFSLAQKKELLNYLLETMVVPEGEGAYRPEAIVRIVDQTGEAPEVNATILTAPYISNGEDQLPRLATPEEALESFVTQTHNEDGAETTKVSNQLFQVLLEAIDSPDNQQIPMEEAFIEVIPVVRRNLRTQKTAENSLFEIRDVGKDGQTNMQNRLTGYAEALLAKFIKRPKEGDSTRLWVPCTFNTIQLENNDGDHPEPVDYQFIGDIVTNEVFPKGYEMGELPTNNFTYLNAIKAVFGSDEIAVEQATKAAQRVNEAEQAAKLQSEKPATANTAPKQAKQPAAPKKSEAKKADLADDLSAIAGKSTKPVEQSQFEDDSTLQDGMIAASQSMDKPTSSQEKTVPMETTSTDQEDHALMSEMFAGAADQLDDSAELDSSEIYSEQSIDDAMNNEQQFNDISEEEEEMFNQLLEQSSTLSMR